MKCLNRTIDIINCVEFNATKERGKKRAKLLGEHREKFTNPYIADGLGYIDKVIFPRATRSLICKGFDVLASKRLSRPPKKYGNIPL